MTENKKVAVVLFNLGGPDFANAVYPFLINFFMDKNIIRVPIPFRCLLAWLIARKRSTKEAKESYDALGGSSPLLANSKAQADALQKMLENKNDEVVTYKSFMCMRYWHPMSAQVVREVRDWGADEVIIIPLYPQFSTTTTWSSLEVWNKAAYQAGYHVPTSMVCCYPFNDGFVKASAANILAEYQKALDDGYDNLRILFSAHGLPESIIKEGDPYQWQCEESARKIADLVKDQLDLDTLDWTICYQSRVGPKKWIGPSTEEEIERAAKDGKAIIIYPHAFTQEHVETLVELDEEYKEYAEEKGQHGYYRAQTVGTHPDFIKGLRDLVYAHEGSLKITAEGSERICAKDFEDCCMQKSVEGLARFKLAS